MLITKGKVVFLAAAAAALVLALALTSCQLIAPQARFAAQPTAGDAPLRVQFADQSKGWPSSWDWDFGDGSKGTDQSPAHEYTKAGSYSVSLKASNRAGSDEITKQSLVTVSAGPLGRIEIHPKSLEVTAGSRGSFTARAYDSSGNEVTGIVFSWKASVGEIDSQGAYRAGTKAGGFPDAISVNAEHKGAAKKTSADVNIAPGSPAKLTIQPANATVKAGETATFRAEAVDAFANIVQGMAIDWQVVGGGGAVSPEGLFTAAGKPGMYADTVRVSLPRLPVEPAKATITVVPGAMDKVEVSPSGAKVGVKGELQFQARAFDKFGNEIPAAKTEWKVGDPAKGKVSDRGMFTAGTVAAKFENLVQVTASVEDKMANGAATLTITSGPPARLSMDSDSVTLAIGEKKAFRATVADSYGNTIAGIDPTWSLRGGGGELDKSGVFVAGNKAGLFKDTVQARVAEKSTVLTALSTVTVLPDPLEKLQIVPQSVTIGIGMTQQFAAVATDQFGNRLSNVSLTWSVTGGGSLDSRQLFTAGEKPGTFTSAMTVQARQGTLAKAATVSITVEADRVAFKSDRGADVDIYTMDGDGSNVRRITDRRTQPGTLKTMSLSPDGQRFVFHMETRRGNETRVGIRLVNSDGSDEKALTSGREPSWSPNGKRIAYVLQMDGNDDIYVADADGSSQTRLTSGPASDLEPSWSPDGKKIAFTSNRGGNWEVYVMDVDGRNPKRLTTTAGGSLTSWPKWSPDGNRILFQSQQEDKNQFFVMNADGSNVTQITNKSLDQREASWSPDGRRIVFASNRDGNPEIYVMDADGSNQTRLTFNAAIDTSPQFFPRKKGVPVKVEVPATVTPSVSAAGSVEEVVALVKPSVVRLTSAAGDGSGFVIDPSGLILTNNHVVENAQVVGVHFDDGRSFSGTVVGQDFVLDLAIVRISAAGLAPAILWNSGQLKAGETVVVLGFPGGLKGGVSVASGRFSAARLDEEKNITWIQTDAAINPGNSGGPLINSRGEVVGIVTKKQVTVGGVPAEGLGFAISSEDIKAALPRLMPSQ